MCSIIANSLHDNDLSILGGSGSLLCSLLHGNQMGFEIKHRIGMPEIVFLLWNGIFGVTK